MTFKQRIEAIDTYHGQGMRGVTPDEVKDQAAEVAAEADALMDEMAEAITAYATAKTESQAREAQTKLLKVYGEVRGNT